MSNRRTFAKIGGLTPSRPIPVEVKPTEADVEIGQGIAHHTSPFPRKSGGPSPGGRMRSSFLFWQPSDGWLREAAGKGCGVPATMRC
jgi:hypothetical protein